MHRTKLQRISAMIGVIILVFLMVLTVIFLFIGNVALAVTSVAINGFVSIILFFILRFHRHVVDDDIVPDDNQDNL